MIRFTADYGRQQSTETPKRPLTTTVWDLLRCVRLFFRRTLSFQGRVPAIFFLLAFTCERKTPLDAHRLPVVHHTHRPSLCVPSPWTRTVPESLSPRQDYRNPLRAARSRPDEPQQQSIARIPFIPRASYAVSSLSLIRRVISWRRARKPFLSSTSTVRCHTAAVGVCVREGGKGRDIVAYFQHHRPFGRSRVSDAFRHGRTITTAFSVLSVAAGFARPSSLT